MVFVEDLSCCGKARDFVFFGFKKRPQLRWGRDT